MTFPILTSLVALPIAGAMVLESYQSAVARGARKIVAIAVYTTTPQATTPCGACRQVLAEFGSDALVICFTDIEAAEQRHSLAELLPRPFGPDSL